MAGGAVAALALSRLTARCGRRAALSTGAAVAIAGCGAGALAATSGRVALLLIGSALLGSGNTAVMLGRYAAAELASESSRARAMSSVLAATTIGAVTGPNLLAPSTTVATAAGLPALTGPFLIAAVAFAVAAGVLATGLPRLPPQDRAAGPGPGRAPVLGADGRAGIVVLASANLVMVAVMTMAASPGRSSVLDGMHAQYEPTTSWPSATAARSPLRRRARRRLHRSASRRGRRHRGPVQRHRAHLRGGQDGDLHPRLRRVQRFPGPAQRRGPADWGLRARPRGRRMDAAGHAGHPRPRPAAGAARCHPALPHLLRDLHRRPQGTAQRDQRRPPARRGCHAFSA